MRILVLSDSHGCVEPMEQCVERVQPQVILHLGDCVRDAQRLEERCPRIPLLGVPGNCDYGSADQPERLTELGSRDPDTVAELIVNKAAEKYGIRERDDLTVMVAAI